MKQADPIAALEIGTSRTVLAVGEALGNGRVKIAGYAAIPSTGVKKSQITDLQQASFAVDAALKKIDHDTPYAIGQAHLVMGGMHIRSLFHSTQMDVAGVVKDEDLTEIFNQAAASGFGLDDANRMQLEVTEAGYELDDLVGVVSPKGMSGRKLKLHTLVVHGANARIDDVKRVLETVKLGIEDYAFAGVSAARAVLTDDMKKAGTLVIDLGAGSTSYAVYSSGRLAGAGVLGVGGNHVTNDIRYAFSISFSQAEELKRRVSTAIFGTPDSEGRAEVPFPSPGSTVTSVSKRALATVVNARLRELLAYIQTDLNRKGLLDLVTGGAGIVFTGGGSAQNGLLTLARGIFGCPVLAGSFVPAFEGLEAIDEPLRSASVFGTLLRAAESDEPDDGLFSSFRNMFGKRK